MVSRSRITSRICLWTDHRAQWYESNFEILRKDGAVEGLVDKGLCTQSRFVPLLVSRILLTETARGEVLWMSSSKPLTCLFTLVQVSTRHQAREEQTFSICEKCLPAVLHPRIRGPRASTKSSFGKEARHRDRNPRKDRSSERRSRLASAACLESACWSTI